MDISLSEIEDVQRKTTPHRMDEVSISGDFGNEG